MGWPAHLPLVGGGGVSKLGFWKEVILVGDLPISGA